MKRVGDKVIEDTEVEWGVEVEIVQYDGTQRYEIALFGDDEGYARLYAQVTGCPLVSREVFIAGWASVE